MLVLTLLVVLAAGSPAPGDDIPELGPTRRIKGLVKPVSKVVMFDLTPRDPRFTLTLGWLTGSGPSYYAYPLPSPTALVNDVDGQLVCNVSRFRLVADSQKRLSGRGWSTDVVGQIRIASPDGFVLSLATEHSVISSGDLLYRGPTEVGLGMRRTASVHLFGAAVRRGVADHPAVELSVLAGASRVQQNPELWLGNQVVHERYPLPQITRNPVVAARLRSSFDVTKRFALTGSVGYTRWSGERSSLVPDQMVTVTGGIRFAVRRWCSVSTLGRWSSDNRGSSLYRTSAMLGLTVHKW